MASDCESRQALDEPERDDVADQDARRRARDEHAEAWVPGTVGVGREHDLGHVDVGHGEAAADQRPVLGFADHHGACTETPGR